MPAGNKDLMYLIANGADGAKEQHGHATGFFALGNSGGWGLSTDLVSLAALCCSFPTLVDVLRPSSAGV